MATLQEQLALLRAYNKAVQERDPKLAEEVRDRMGEETVTESAVSPEEIDRQVEQETIVMRRERPVLAVKENVTQLVFIDKVDSEIWGERLKNAKPVLDTAIPAVGRIDLRGAPLGFVGTGWLVSENVIVTNRHVAEEFAMRRGEGFTFKTGPTGAPMSSSVDFLEELDNPAKLVFNLVRPLHIEDRPGPDLAFFEIEMVSGDAKLAKPIDLVAEIGEIEHVATIGYPAYDSRIPEPELMERIYGKTYNKKRLAPGGITRLDPVRIWHNCTTLGGNSGSLVFDLDKGKAVGLHFSGSFLVTNYAVRADVVKKLLADVRAGRAVRRTEAPTRPQAPLAAQAARPAIATTQRGSGGKATLNIPLTVNVSISLDGARSALRDRGFPAAASSVEIADNIAETESVAADYHDREGYVADFLGKKFKIDLPEVTRDAGDVLDFEIDGQTQTELRYQHYSVVMSRSRRMCFFSACNIDGQQSRKSARVAWKWDPRIPKSQQVMKECYGSPPKFSRGHMTRREDPGWGTPAEAKLGNEDSMHVTNTTPQMQAFNAPIWLALEDYALQHAREDDMKISVFTGPYFSDKDPEMYGVPIPLAFWKIIAFIHDETGKLCATGYHMNQESTLQPEEEFVFGAFTSPQLQVATQVPIRTIESRSGISFGRLAGFDPLAGGEEAVPGALMALEQIRFV
jgi:endonuclease G